VKPADWILWRNRRIEFFAAESIRFAGGRSTREQPRIREETESMSWIHRLPTKRLVLSLLLASTLVLLNGCGTTFRHRLTGSWIGPTMEYEFHPNGQCRYAFRTDDGPRWMTGRWWVESAGENRATIKFSRSSPRPPETYAFTAEFESGDMIQLSKKRGKFRLVRVDHAIDGRFKGPWGGREKYPYWLTVREPGLR
jgi:hypothetical protein